MKAIAVFLVACALSVSALAKLPPPNDEAKAKAAEAKAKADHAAKVDAYKLCKSQNRIAAQYRAGGKGKPVETPPCADPGPFVYKPADAAAPAAAAPAPASEKKKSTKSAS